MLFLYLCLSVFDCCSFDLIVAFKFIFLQMNIKQYGIYIYLIQFMYLWFYVFFLELERLVFLCSCSLVEQGCRFNFGASRKMMEL